MSEREDWYALSETHVSVDQRSEFRRLVDEIEWSDLSIGQDHPMSQGMALEGLIRQIRVKGRVLKYSYSSLWNRLAVIAVIAEYTNATVKIAALDDGVALTPILGVVRPVVNA